MRWNPNPSAAMIRRAGIAAFIVAGTLAVMAGSSDTVARRYVSWQLRNEGPAVEQGMITLTKLMTVGLVLPSAKSACPEVFDPEDDDGPLHAEECRALSGQTSFNDRWMPN